MKSAKRMIIAALAVILALTTALPAFAAASPTPWRSAYTPYKCTYKFTENMLTLSNMAWNQESVDWYNQRSIPYWEFEVNNLSVGDPRDYWEDYAVATTSTLPGAYGELDENDITIGTSRPDDVTAGTSYSASMHVFRYDPLIAPLPSQVTYSAESETGAWYGVDGMPAYYQVHASNRVMGQQYSWNQTSSTPFALVGNNTSESRGLTDTTLGDVAVKILGERGSESAATSSVLLAQKVLEKDTQKYDALVVFDEYLNPASVSEDYSNIQVAYFAVPGKTGRTIAGIRNNDIDGTIRQHIEAVRQEEDTSEEILAIMDEYEAGNIGVFAVRVSGTPAELQKILDSGNCTLELHDTVRSGAQSVKIIEVPDKPDKELGIE